MASDQQHMAKIASSGGKATASKYGSEHFKKLADKRWKKQRNAIRPPSKV